MSDYYQKRDLLDFPKIVEDAPEAGKKFFDYYAAATGAGEGALSERERALIAIAVAATQNCPYCIDAWTEKCLSLGLSGREMMEAVHVGAAMQAGVTLVHATQLRKAIREREI